MTRGIWGGLFNLIIYSPSWREVSAETQAGTEAEDMEDISTGDKRLWIPSKWIKIWNNQEEYLRCYDCGHISGEENTGGI